MRAQETEVPLYAVEFLDSERLVVAGGGGEGRHGVKNKVVSLYIDDKGLHKDIEYTFPPGNDNPTSMAVHSDKVYVGANFGRTDIQKQENKHLRVFDARTLEENYEFDVFNSTDPEVYQKATAVSTTHLALVSSDSEKSKAQLKVVERKNPNKHIWCKPLESPASDACFSPDGNLLALCSEERAFVLNAESGDLMHEIKAPKNTKVHWLRLKFISNTRLILAAKNGPRDSVSILVYDVSDSGSLLRQAVVPQAKAVTCLDASENHVVVATPSGDVVVFNVFLSLITRKKNVHRLPITGVAIQSTSNYVATVSLSGKVDVFNLPQINTGAIFSMKTLAWALISGVVMLLVALALGSRIVRTGDFSLSRIAALGSGQLKDNLITWASQAPKVTPSFAGTAPDSETCEVFTIDTLTTETPIEPVPMDPTEPAEAEPAEAELAEAEPAEAEPAGTETAETAEGINSGPEIPCPDTAVAETPEPEKAPEAEDSATESEETPAPTPAEIPTAATEIVNVEHIPETPETVDVGTPDTVEASANFETGPVEAPANGETDTPVPVTIAEPPEPNLDTVARSQPRDPSNAQEPEERLDQTEQARGSEEVQQATQESVPSVESKPHEPVKDSAEQQDNQEPAKEEL